MVIWVGCYLPPRREGRHVLKVKLALDGPLQKLCSWTMFSTDTPDGSPPSAIIVYLDLPSDMPVTDAHPRVSVKRRKPCANPHDNSDMSRCLPSEFTQYVLNNFSDKIPPVPRPPKMTLRLPVNKSRWGKLPATSRFVVKVGNRGDVRDAMDGLLYQ